MSELLVDARHVGVTFSPPQREPVHALRDITLPIHRGELVAVIGSSGAGKTTLLRCLTGFVQPSVGGLLVNGIDLNKPGGSELRLLRRQVATIYQHFNLVERLTALDNVLHGRLGYVSVLAGLLGIFPDYDRRLAYQTLIELGLGDQALQRVDQLSGGERQRVTIARALVQEPVMVLADEPAASLDLSLTRQVISLLYNLNQRSDLTVVVNLHDLELARSFASRIIGLRNGVIYFDGPPSELTTEHVDAIFYGPTTTNEPRRIHAVA